VAKREMLDGGSRHEICQLGPPYGDRYDMTHLHDAGGGHAGVLETLLGGVDPLTPAGKASKAAHFDARVSGQGSSSSDMCQQSCLACMCSRLDIGQPVHGGAQTFESTCQHP